MGTTRGILGTSCPQRGLSTEAPQGQRWVFLRSSRTNNTSKKKTEKAPFNLFQGLPQEVLMCGDPDRESCQNPAASLPRWTGQTWWPVVTWDSSNNSHDIQKTVFGGQLLPQVEEGTRKFLRKFPPAHVPPNHTDLSLLSSSRGQALPWHSARSLRGTV